MEFNILICGVGGQGTILASYILGNAALREGYKVRLGEVHGMAQRGALLFPMSEWVMKFMDQSSHKEKQI